MVFLPLILLLFSSVIYISFYINRKNALNLVKQLILSKQRDMTFYLIRLEKERIIKEGKKNELINTYISKATLFLMNILIGTDGYNAMFTEQGKMIVDSKGSIRGKSITFSPYYKLAAGYYSSTPKFITFELDGIKRFGSLFYFRPWKIYVLQTISEEEYFKPIAKFNFCCNGSEK
jgi:predicted methyltransferase